MSWQLKLYLTEQVLILREKANESGDEQIKAIADELNEVLNGVLEIRGTVS